MTLIVHALGAYPSYSRELIAWRGDDYNVNKFVKALKRKEFQGHGSLPSYGGGRRQFTYQAPANALVLFAEWGAARVFQLRVNDRVLVPVPSSTCTSFGMDSAPVRMVQALSGASGMRMGFWLRFAHVLPSAAAAGGSRNPGFLAEKLIVIPGVAGQRVVLVDDVKTTGGHLLACARVLRAAGAQVDLALVAASTVWQQHADPLSVGPVDIEPAPWSIFRQA